MKSQKGTPLLSLSGYKFCVHYCKNFKVRWQCSTHTSRGCKAAVFTVDGTVVSYEPTFIKSRMGTNILLYCGYTYYRHRTCALKTRWSCSTHYTRKCKACIFTVNNEIVHYKLEHNHPPVKNAL
ncbi:hypothetical protein EVAR_17883_1 [Eumeta japonica]|uniref:FLYWCH-type domain-containing protein n=1 Tax=Eumeta variegata TaxID=151549 RepID=A0A4C1UY49_EUMVA|nr:hypothetical protein EVAR_17883_1 [Eumeta japonica]